MNQSQALSIVTAIGHERGLLLLDTLDYMQTNLYAFDKEEKLAFRIVMNSFAEVFAE